MANNTNSSKTLYSVIGIFTAVICLSLCGIVAVLVLGLNLGNPSVSVTPALPAGDPNELMVKAVPLMQQGRYEEAIPLWTAIINQVPHRDTAYHQRSICYYNLLPQQASMEGRKLYAQNALADIDRAIAIQPRVGDYYSYRHDVIVAFTGWEEYRADQQAIVRIAHENVEAAITLGYSPAYGFTNRVYISDLTTLEQCEESLAGIKKLLGEANPNDSTIGGLYLMKAQAQACLGDYSEAAQTLDISLPFTAEKEYLRALYLYQQGEPDKALEVLNQNITREPSYTGYRYYLRALIHYERGEKDQVNADLTTGSQNTWGRMGLYAYVLGKMELEAGEQGKGIDWLQQAEASLDHNHMFIRSKIIQELAELGAEPLAVTPSPKFTSTPIPFNHP